MIKRKNIYVIILPIILILNSCVVTCDCSFGEKAFAFQVDYRSYQTNMSINEFVNTKDSTGKPKYYSIKVYTDKYDSNSAFFESWGDGKGDSIVGFTCWEPPYKVIIDIGLIGVHHTFSSFITEGYSSSLLCRCFKVTKKVVTMDDSVNFDAINKPVVLKK